MLRLILESAGGPVRKLPLRDLGREPDPGWRVGRSADSDVVLRWPGVSKSHARLLFEDGDLWLVDEKSKNGLIADGRRLERVRLIPGRPVQVGRGFVSLEDVATNEVEIGPEDKEAPEESRSDRKSLCRAAVEAPCWFRGTESDRSTLCE